jgi:hypothetical protein
MIGEFNHANFKYISNGSKSIYAFFKKLKTEPSLTGESDFFRTNSLAFGL